MTFWHHLRIGARTWMGTPLTAIVIVLTLALGIGLNTAIFGLVNVALLRPLPYRDPGRLVSLSAANVETGRRDKVSGADLADWRSRSTVFKDFATYWDTAFTLPGDLPVTLPSWDVSPNLFTLLGVPASLGRTLVPEDGRPGSPRVVVLSHRLWVQTFGGKADVIGQRLRLQRLDGVGSADESYEIVGVMPPSFAHPSPSAALWAPLTADLAQNRQLPVFQVIARVRPGVSLPKAQDELKGIAATLSKEHPDTNATRTAVVRDIRDIYSGDVRLSLWVLQGAALALLLIGCTNVTNLLVARAIARHRQVAIRQAIGATRWQIFQQSLAEMIVLASVASALGVLFATWGAEILPRLLRSQLTSLLLPNGRSEWITPSILAAVVGLTSLICCLLSAIPVMRSGKAAALASDPSRTSSAPRWALRARAGFMVGQVALSLCLLIAAGLLVRSFVRLQDRSLGFRTDHILSGVFFLPLDRYVELAQRELFLRDLTTRLRALPGVKGAAAVSTLPLTGNDARRPYQIPGASRREDQWTQFRVATPMYFDVMDIPLRRGRLFDDRDRAGSTQVAIINETFAKTLWPDDDPVGKTILVPDFAPPAQALQIIGVVGDVRHLGAAADLAPELYRPAYQTTWPFFGLVIRTADDPAQLIPSARAAVASLDRTIALGEGLRPFDDLAADSVGLRRASMTLVTLFAVFALTLAVVGAYGLVAYVVAQRTREFGIRLALGARHAQVYGAALRYGLVPVLIGIVAGVAGALAGSRVLQSLLFEVTPYDPVTFAFVSLMFLVVGSLAMFVPAHRAAMLDPVAALRHD